MKKLFFLSCVLVLLPGFAGAKTILCSSDDNSVQIRIAYGPKGEPPPGIEVRRAGEFDDFLIVRSPGLQSSALVSNGSIGGWTYKGQFDRNRKSYLFVLSVVTNSPDGAADSASWYFNTEHFEEFTVLGCK